MKYLGPNEQNKTEEKKPTAEIIKPDLKTELTTSKAKTEKKSFLKFRAGKVNLTSKMFFLDNLSTMLKAGLALAPALNTLSKEVKNKYLQQVILHLKNRVENGQPLSVSMKEYPDVFQEMIIATVEVGENTGLLADALGNLANILKAQKKLRSKVVGAMMYPVIVLIALGGVSVFLALFVFPQLVTIFQDSNIELPFVLKAVQAMIDIMKNYAGLVIIAFIVLLVGTIMTLKLPKPKLLFHKFLLKIPFVGNLIKELALTRFTSNLNALLISGLSIVKSLEIVAKTLANTYYRQTLLTISEELARGVSLADAMAQRPKLFPSLTVQLCEVGESTGELDDILKKIANYYEERVNNVLANLSSIIEPVLLILVGLAVGFIAISVIGPMYELTLSFGE
ncbi:type II secretion system F family protein [Patescibacteria group bacterium]|jgi:type IV pilus assembly protein PilC|nr:type II secretion system F family protein [Patescibacteria group bacterium]